MRPFHSLLALCLAVVWLPLGVHCELERLGLLGDSLVCCAPSDATPPVSTGDGHEQPDGCCAFESAPYTFQKSAPAPVAWLAVQLPRTVAPMPPRLPARVERPGDPPGYALRAGWQFALRAAAPPRAPSFAS